MPQSPSLTTSLNYKPVSSTPTSYHSHTFNFSKNPTTTATHNSNILTSSPVVSSTTVNSNPSSPMLEK